MMPDDPIAHWKEWARRYLKHKDVMLRSITDIDDDGDTALIIKRRDGAQEHCLCSPTLTDAIENIGGDHYAKILIVTNNSQNNVLSLVESWDRFVKDRRITIIFTDGEKKWSVTPFVHARISENIKAGLLSLYENAS